MPKCCLDAHAGMHPPGLQAARTHEVLEQSAKRAAQVAKHVLHGNMPEWFLGQGAEIGRAAKKEGYRRVLRRQKANRRNTEDQWLRCHRRCLRCPKPSGFAKS